MPPILDASASAVGVGSPVTVNLNHAANVQALVYVGVIAPVNLTAVTIAGEDMTFETSIALLGFEIHLYFSPRFTAANETVSVSFGGAGAVDLLAISFTEAELAGDPFDVVATNSGNSNQATVNVIAGAPDRTIIQGANWDAITGYVVPAPQVEIIVSVGNMHLEANRYDNDGAFNMTLNFAGVTAWVTIGVGLMGTGRDLWKRLRKRRWWR